MLLGNLVPGAQNTHLVPNSWQTRFKLVFVSPSKDPSEIRKKGDLITSRFYGSKLLSSIPPWQI